MRSRLTELRALWFAALVIGAASSAACVIGPKQDDPVSATPALDAAADTGSENLGGDSAAGTADTTGDKETDSTIVDGAPPSDTSVSDAPPSDGGDADAADGADSAGEVSDDALEGG